MKALALALMLLAGCAALPPCPNPEIHVVTTQGGQQYYVFEPAQAVQLRALLKGLAERTCSPNVE